MNRYQALPALLIALAACGGGDVQDAPAGAAPAPAPAPAASLPAPPAGDLSIPEWYAVDHDARTVSMTVTAGSTPEANYWNYNGFIKGGLQISVPEGYAVTIEFVNQDPNMAHSLGIQADYNDPMIPPPPTPAFEGAITPNPQSMIDGTMPGQTATVQFVADAAGSYKMVCYVAGHTALGMWLWFEVSAAGDAGVRGL